MAGERHAMCESALRGWLAIELDGDASQMPCFSNELKGYNTSTTTTTTTTISSSSSSSTTTTNVLTSD